MLADLLADYTMANNELTEALANPMATRDDIANLALANIDKVARLQRAVNHAAEIATHTAALVAEAQGAM